MPSRARQPKYGDALEATAKMIRLAMRAIEYFIDAILSFLGGERARLIALTMPRPRMYATRLMPFEDGFFFRATTTLFQRMPRQHR